MEVTASSGCDLDETRVWFGSDWGVRGERTNLHRLREKSLCTGGLKLKEPVSGDTRTDWMPERMSSGVHTNACVCVQMGSYLSILFNFFAYILIKLSNKIPFIKIYINLQWAI